MTYDNMSRRSFATGLICFVTGHCPTDRSSNPIPDINVIVLVAHLGSQWFAFH